MNRKLLLMILFSLLFITVSTNLGSSFFSKSHIIWNIEEFSRIDSVMTRECRPYLKEVIDFNVGADAPILHYYDSGVSSYISTHTRQVGYQSCLEEAGSDIKLKCGCYGQAIHFATIDRFAHLSE